MLQEFLLEHVIFMHKSLKFVFVCIAQVHSKQLSEIYAIAELTAHPV